jgi:hypothetical protein
MNQFIYIEVRPHIYGESKCGNFNSHWGFCCACFINPVGVIDVVICYDLHLSHPGICSRYPSKETASPLKQGFLSHWQILLYWTR